MSTTKVTPIKAVVGPDSMVDTARLLMANTVLKGLTGNAAFANPVVPLATFGNDITTYSNAITAAEDGGKNAKAARAKAKKVVITDLKQLANYVENNCNDDMATFTTSGFTAKAKASAAGPVAVPTFKSLDYGTHPGEILVTVKSVLGGKSYNIRYGAMPAQPQAAAPGAAPASWTTISVASTKKAIAFDTLTTGTVYAFQVQALGLLGLSAWSDSSTITCP